VSTERKTALLAQFARVGKALGKARDDGKRSVLMRVKSEQGTRFVAIPLSRA